MSDNILPYDIQLEIIKKVSDVKLLLRFRSVSKPWKSFIDSPQFISGYGSRPTHPQSLLIRYKDNVYPNEVKYVSFVDDENNDTLTQHQQQEFAPNVVTNQMKEFNDLKVIGSSHGLLCFSSYDKHVLVLWNPSIRKSVSIKLPYLPFRNEFLGFAVCPANNDPTIVMITYPWNVGIFKLSSKRFNVFKYTKLPPKSVRPLSSQVVIDTCIYWAAYEIVYSIQGWAWMCKNYMIMSFDFIANEIKLVDIPRTCILSDPFLECFFISKLRESLLLFVPKKEVQITGCEVWKMAHDASFTKQFTIKTPNYTIGNMLGFRKNGEELVMETQKDNKEFVVLEVYDPCSERITNLGIYGEKGSFSMDSYKETLLLLDELDSCVCSDIN